MSTGNNYNVIIDGSLFVNKSCLVNGQLTSSVIKSLGDVSTSSYSLNTLGDIIRPCSITKICSISYCYIFITSCITI